MENMATVEDTGEDLNFVYDGEPGNFQTKHKKNTTRLSALFKGKEELKVNISLPLELDATDPAKYNKSMEDLLRRLIDPEGELVKAIMGDNLGITQELLDAYGMRPPIISLEQPRNPIIYCDDPSIDGVYGEDDEKTVNLMSVHLSPLNIESIYSKCNESIEYTNAASCSEDPDVCGATLCTYRRSILDGCKQKSNTVYESVRILPRRPFFRTFPDDLTVSCDRDVKVKENETTCSGNAHKSS